MAAVCQNGLALRWASNRLREDRRIVIAAVQNDSAALDEAMPDLAGDKEVVMAAVGNCGRALQYASDELQSDREVVLKAVTTYGSAARWACAELKNDWEIVTAALMESGMALREASSGCRANHTLQKLAFAFGPESMVGLVLAAWRSVCKTLMMMRCAHAPSSGTQSLWRVAWKRSLQRLRR